MKKKKKTADSILLRWYWLGILCAVIASLGAYGILNVHTVNSSSGFAEKEQLFALDCTEWSDFRITCCIFGKSYCIERKNERERPSVPLRQVRWIGCGRAVSGGDREEQRMARLPVSLGL